MPTKLCDITLYLSAPNDDGFTTDEYPSVEMESVVFPSPHAPYLRFKDGGKTIRTSLPFLLLEE